MFKTAVPSITDFSLPYAYALKTIPSSVFQKFITKVSPGNTWLVNLALKDFKTGAGASLLSLNYYITYVFTTLAKIPYVHKPWRIGFSNIAILDTLGSICKGLSSPFNLYHNA